MSNLHKLHGLGQSVWLDFIRRSHTRSGELARLVAAGVRGVTSNPTIFDKAISGGGEYDLQIAEESDGAADAESLYEALAIVDVREAADNLRPVYDESRRTDGYVSLEVSPELARDSEGTIVAARRLYQAVGRPNVMIKIPATPECIPAIRAVVCSGINVNVTLIFSIAQYEAVVEAYLSGLEEMASFGADPSQVASVASFFVSRIDTAVERELAERSASIDGSPAVDNARVAYARFRELFTGPRWSRLAQSGAHMQRLLWASTGTKSDALPDTFYVDELIGSPTVNTVPPATLDAFLDHGTVSASLERDLDGAIARRKRLAELGVDLGSVGASLQAAGVESFAQSFASLLASLEQKRRSLGV